MLARQMRVQKIRQEWVEEDDGCRSSRSAWGSEA
jgi:hypothetical protein